MGEYFINRLWVMWEFLFQVSIEISVDAPTGRSNVLSTSAPDSSKWILIYFHILGILVFQCSQIKNIRQLLKDRAMGPAVCRNCDNVVTKYDWMKMASLVTRCKNISCFISNLINYYWMIRMTTAAAAAAARTNLTNKHEVNKWKLWTKR